MEQRQASLNSAVNSADHNPQVGKGAQAHAEQESFAMTHDLEGMCMDCLVNRYVGL